VIKEHRGGRKAHGRVRCSCCKRNAEVGGGSLYYGSHQRQTLSSFPAGTEESDSGWQETEGPRGLSIYERPVGEARTSRDSLSKRKAEGLSSSDCPSEPASRRPAPEHLFDDGPEALGELAALGSRQLDPTEGGLVRAAMAAGDASPQQPSGTHKSTAKGAYHSAPAVSSEADARRMSLGDMSGPLCGMPIGATTYAQVASNSAAPAPERHNKIPIYISGVTDTRGFLAWVLASCPSGLSAQTKGEKLMLVPRTAEGFRAAVSALRSLGGSKGLSFHTFSLPEDRCVRLLVKNLGRLMPEKVVREELENLGISVQGILLLRSGRRDQKAATAHRLTPHFIVSVARGPQVAKVRSITELCGLRVTVETYVAPKGPLQCKRCQRFGHTQRYCGYAPLCYLWQGSPLRGVHHPAAGA
jgi:hypothetical protein